MKSDRSRSPLVTGIVGFVAGAALSWAAIRHATPAFAQPAALPKASDDLAALRADVERLKATATDQSHVMTDVAHQFSCLWFAGHNDNWPLAEFFFSETQSHLRWAVRVIPVRKDAAGRDVDLRAILQAIETSSLKDLHDTIAAKDRPKFETAYRTMTQSCYSCHEAASKPYLRPKVPERPDTEILEFRPQ